MWAIQLITAIVLALPTAWNREAHSRTAGLRTFPLVAMGACSFIIIGHHFTGVENPDSMARIVQGLLTGIGFIGGGAILKNDDHVKGTASAAAIWITGAMGVAVGFQMWILATMLSALNFAVVYFLSRMKSEVNHSSDR
jgi:putative Mg2+ transporter-C (MgtC) family protein